jgi:hypothetical protein
MNKPTNEENDNSSTNNSNNVQEDNVDKLILLIKYKEDLIQNNESSSIYVVKELMCLYQKVIEILSLKGDLNFKVYLEKLHKMLENQDVQAQLEQETKLTKICELSNSYKVAEDTDIEDNKNEETTSD